MGGSYHTWLQNRGRTGLATGERAQFRRGVSQPAPERLLLARGTLWLLRFQAHTFAHFNSPPVLCTNWRPHTVNEIPCSGGAAVGDDNPSGASERKTGPLFTQLKWSGRAPWAEDWLSTAAPPPLPRPVGRPLTHTPSPLPHTFRRVWSATLQVTLPPFTGTQHTQEGHTV